MKKFLLYVALLCLTMSAAAQTKVDLSKAAHHIEFNTLTDDDTCSATAVGEHTLLTAAHCVQGTSKITIDDKDYSVKSLEYDEQDHALVRTDATFDVKLPIDERKPVANEPVKMWGWPGDSDIAVYREGYFVKVEQVDLGVYGNMFVLPVFPGDSGAGIISADEKVIGVQSLGDKNARAISFTLAFTPEQLAAIQ